MTVGSNFRLENVAFHVGSRASESYPSPLYIGSVPEVNNVRHCGNVIQAHVLLMLKAIEYRIQCPAKQGHKSTTPTT